MKRGDIYFIKAHEAIGSETAKARPGVLVSNNILNATSPVVEVVYLTTKPKKDMPTHATIHATGTSSTAICEHIDHVDKTLIDNWVGTCTEEEMRAVDKALLCSLGLDASVPEYKTAEDIPDPDAWLAEIERLTEERDRYARVIDRLLETNA